ncbi:TPA: 4-alpha-glucanotransferase [Candidatus Scatenecus faecavium]|uniref:4-alpha-glucanotransferase n=1 Tax=Candidatus Scatenecus faecavium TaxID=2840915 RepID=A0A9D1FVJ3_9BACT|nr:4-alpha-glucanotransferase [Candidatus Scatenecus faecavium]
MVCTVNYTDVIQKALKALDKKNFALIMHSGSFPAAAGENTGFGTINSNGGREVIDYAKGIFNAIQLGPAGKTKSCDSSPYTGTIFSGNPLFIDLKQLTGNEWNNILSVETYSRIVENNPNKDVNKTAYSYIYKQQNEALEEAWRNFKEKGSEALKKEFETYKIENDYWLDKDSLYEALSIEHGNDYWPLWNSETDKNLFNPKSTEEKIEFSKRINEISKKYEDEIDKYKFIQFVLNKQNDKTREYAKQAGIKMIADRQVAFSDRDTWAYQSLFLEGWMLGCPPDYFSKDGQAWGFPVMDPDRMYNDDGSLDEGGILLKNLYKKMFRENPGGVRIDHIVGLIDPWVYKAGKKPKIEQGAGRLYSSPEHPELCKYAIARMEDLDTTLEADKEKRVKTLSQEQIHKYGRLIEKIVIAAAEEEGLDKDAIVCEDLGTLTNPVAAVMKEYQLQGMRLTQFVVAEKPEHPYRCCNIDGRCWAMVGTHDNEPIQMWANSMVNTHEGYLHVKNLVEDLFSECENKDEIITNMTKDANFLTETKLVEIFASKAENVQIFFTDFFKIYDVYNRPGTSGDENWSLRLPDNFKDLTPINLANILKRAIIARGKEFADKNQNIIDELSNIE